MKKTLLASMVLLVSSSVFATESQDTSMIKDGVKGLTSSITTMSKDALSGLKDGVDEGRKSGSSIDGAIIIYDKENLNKYTTIRSLSVGSTGENSYLVTLAVKNNSDSLIRLTNLSEKKNIYAIDADDFVAYLDGIQEDVNIPSKTAVKLRLVFKDTEGEPVKIRLYENEVELNKK
ncbi:hypothetical protein I4632_08505 [Proteus mirabilis]|uniref:hypothetical protein n=1 Tax=Proteus TaxID=583 RepID=UPI0018C581CD|nr:hypothetical protein [Proteus vulgaris]MBG3080252.1 hypothetical protein [Proteus mirabilis]QPN88059.1 hypothetical protein IM703_09420 [Proteus vulgaris]WIF71327.1 hypothetical protein QN092_15270 [Proteus vulgaris]